MFLEQTIYITVYIISYYTIDTGPASVVTEGSHGQGT